MWTHVSITVILPWMSQTSDISKASLTQTKYVSTLLSLTNTKHLDLKHNAPKLMGHLKPSLYQEFLSA